MKSKTGQIDVVELKKAFLRSALVKETDHPGFNDNAHKLLNQLRDYGDYFKVEANREWVLKKYGLAVNSPLLIGVIGNNTTFDKELVERCLGANRENYRLYSYHGLVDMIRAAPSFMNVPEPKRN